MALNVMLPNHKGCVVNARTYLHVCMRVRCQTDTALGLLARAGGEKWHLLLGVGAKCQASLARGRHIAPGRRGAEGRVTPMTSCACIIQALGPYWEVVLKTMVPITLFRGVATAIDIREELKG